MKNRPKVTVYTDGSSRGNPGPGGFGAVLAYIDLHGETHYKELSAGYCLTTNNRMELMGAIAALEALKCPCDVELYSDSQYVVNAFNQHWIDRWQEKGWRTVDKKLVKNSDLWKRLLVAVSRHAVTFIWIKGHEGHDFNERCDALATAAADGSCLLEDEGFVRTDV